jgi:hypothetical protein
MDHMVDLDQALNELERQESEGMKISMKLKIKFTHINSIFFFSFNRIAKKK